MMRSLFGNKWLLIAIVFLLHLYLFQAWKYISRNATPVTKITLNIFFWLLLAIEIGCFFAMGKASERTSFYLFTTIIIIFLGQLFGCVFLLIDDIRRLLVFTGTHLFTKNTDSKTISRSTFLSWVAVLFGGATSGLFLYGITNRYNYKLRKVKFSDPSIPENFKGLKIIQLSDIHSGSFNNKQAVLRGVQMAMAEKPDLILFTGDLVNNRATEMHDYMDIFSQLNAPMGVFSTLGNHDYGDYVAWPTPEAKKENLEALKQLQAKMGWKLLMNENVIFEKNGQKIALLGIENWGAKGHFPKYGRLDLAYKGTENIPFKILMSHDPSHWDAEVRPKYADINLTLSGHTHGMQFGVDIPGFKWSPIKWMYKEWEDLYKEKKQYLYVNRGFGFLGYTGRVGILPEITLFELG